MSAGSGSAAVDRKVPPCLAGDVPVEVWESTGDGHADPDGSLWEAVVKGAEPVLELRAGLGQRLPRLVDTKRRSHDLVVERRHEDVDAVRAHSPRARPSRVMVCRKPRLRADAVAAAALAAGA